MVRAYRTAIRSFTTDADRGRGGGGGGGEQRLDMVKQQQRVRWGCLCGSTGRDCEGLGCV